MVTHAWINAKTGKFAVAAAMAATAAASQALNTLMAERQGRKLALEMKPDFDDSKQKFQALEAQLATAHAALEKAQAAIMAQQQKFDTRNLMLGAVWYVLGIATPVCLKLLGVAI